MAQTLRRILSRARRNVGNSASAVPAQRNAATTQQIRSLHAGTHLRDTHKTSHVAMSAAASVKGQTVQKQPGAEVLFHADTYRSDSTPQCYSPSNGSIELKSVQSESFASGNAGDERIVKGCDVSTGLSVQSGDETHDIVYDTRKLPPWGDDSAGRDKN